MAKKEEVKKKKAPRKGKAVIQRQKELMENGMILSASYSHVNQTKKIIELFREGLTDKEILYKVLQDNPNLKETSAQVYLDSARASYKQEFILTRRFNIIQHVKRYDRDIFTLANFEPRTSSYAKYQFEKTKAYLDMINLLQKKEKVLGFHRKSVQLKIKNTVNIAITKVERSFDFTNLTWEEKLELYHLTEKAWINPNDKLTLKPNPKHLNRVEEIEEIEVVEEEAIPVIDLIQEVAEPLKTIPEIEEKRETEENSPGVTIIDATNKKESYQVSSNTLDEIKRTLLNKIFKQ